MLIAINGSSMPNRDNPLHTLKLMILDTLGAKPTVDRVCQVVAKANATIDHHIAGWREKAEKKVACKSGCAYCCAQAVWVTEPEVINLAQGIRENNLEAMLLGRVEEVLAMTAGNSVVQRTAALVLCPFVYTDNSCFVYGDRPVACRGLYAADVAECISSTRGGPGVHYFGWPAKAATEIRLSMVGAFAARGIRCHTLEFNAAMRIALKDPGAATRWLAGENAFEGAISEEAPIDITLASQLATR